MNKRKLTLNEELTRMSSLFGYMNMPNRLIMEQGTGKTLIQGADGTSTAIVKTIGQEIATEIENSIVKAAKNNSEFLTKIGKTSSDLDWTSLKSLYPDLNGSVLTQKILDDLGSGAKSVYDQITEFALNSTTLKSKESLDASIKDIRKQIDDTINKPNVTKQELDLLRRNIDTTKESYPVYTDVFDTYSAVVNTKIKGMELPEKTVTVKTDDIKSDGYVFKQTDLDMVTTDSKSMNNAQPNTDKKSLFNGLSVSNNSFTFVKPDFSKMGVLDSLEKFNMNMAVALSQLSKNIQSGYDLIPINGFEHYGIDDFREYCKNNIQFINSFNVTDGTWSVTFAKSGEMEVTLKVLTNLDGEQTTWKKYTNIANGPNIIQIVTKDFEAGAPEFDGGVILDTITPEKLIAVTKEEIQKTLNWLKSTEYKNRRMALTNETSDEVDLAVKEIESYLFNNLEIYFYYDKYMFNAGTRGSAKQSNHQWTVKPEDKVMNKTKIIKVMPRKSIESIRGTLNHEIDHIVSATLDGATTKLAFETLQKNIKPLILKFPKHFATDIPVLDEFFNAKNYNLFNEYLETVPEQVTRLRRLYTFASNKYKSDKLTYEQVYDLWQTYKNDWKTNGPPMGYGDVYDFLLTFDKARTTVFALGNKKMIIDLQNILNAVLGIAALVTLNMQPENNSQ
jgi:hypothetical protein